MVVDTSGLFDAVLTPRYDKHSLIGVSADLGSETHRVFGMWTGCVTDDDGATYELDNFQGFAEVARQRW